MIEYKGYTGRVTAIDEKTGVLHGEVMGINDVVTFEGTTAEELVTAFRESVEDYLEFCKTRSEAPDRPYSGKFLARITPDLHRQASLAAKRSGQSLNSLVMAALESHLGAVKRRVLAPFTGLATCAQESAFSSQPVQPNRR